MTINEIFKLFTETGLVFYDTSHYDINLDEFRPQLRQAQFNKYLTEIENDEN